MTEILFYHLESARLEAVLPDLLEKTRARQWRAWVATGDETARDRVDQLLWTFDDASFLPHACDGDPSDHPVWISCESGGRDQRDILFLVEGAPLDLAQMEGLSRCVLIFDGANEQYLQQARESWKQIKESD